MLNSEVVNWILRFALSKSGIAIQWLVALIIGSLAKQNIFPTGDLHEIQLGLTSGFTALAAIAYGFLQWWIQHRQKDGVRAAQAMANVRLSGSGNAPLELDGVAGNATVKALAKATSVPVAHAVNLARGA